MQIINSAYSKNKNMYCSIGFFTENTACILKQFNYLILFDMLRSRSDINNLSKQIFGDKELLLSALHELQKEHIQRVCILLDLRPNCPEPLRLRTVYCKFPSHYLKKYTIMPEYRRGGTKLVLFPRPFLQITTLEELF